MNTGRMIRLFLYVMTGIVMLGGKAEAASKKIINTEQLQCYVVTDSNGDNPSPVVMIYDDGILTQGTDYTVRLLDVGDANNIDGYKYTIIVTGLGDYSGTAYRYGTDYYGELKSKFGFKYIAAPDEEVYVVEYTGNSKDVSLEKLDDAEGVTEVFPGTFRDNSSIQSIDLLDCMLTEYLCINCPSVNMISTNCPEGDELDHVPGPIVAGDLNGYVELNVPVNFEWCYSEDSAEKTMTIEQYCSENPGFVVASSSEAYQPAGSDFSYRIDAAREEAYIVSYEGTAEEVTLPDVVRYNKTNYEITGFVGYVFNGLNNLKTVDFGALPLTNNIFKDCPNLKKIISENRDGIYLTAAIVDGNAPASGTLTISTYTDVSWGIYGSGSGNSYVEMTIREYCEKYGYQFEAIQTQYHDFVIDIADMDYVIAGSAKQLSVYCHMSGHDEDDPVEITDIDPDALVDEWTVVSGDGATVNDNGVLTVSGNVTEVTTANIKAVVSFNDESIRATGTIKIYPKLTGTNNYIVVPPDSKKLSCKQYIASSPDEPSLADLPAGVSVQYHVADDSIVNVDNDGNVSAASTAENDDSTTVTAVYTIDGVKYTFIYNITVGKVQDTSDIGTDIIYVYGWQDSGFDNSIREFTNMYPELKNRIEYVTIELDDQADNYWDTYRSKIDLAMAGGSKVPDIVLWPESRVYENLSANYLVPLENVGFNAASDYVNAFSYTTTKGTWNGQLYAITADINPGCFIYRKDLAKEVIGSDEPDVVQNALKDWDSFMKTAAAFKEKNYYITNAMNLYYPLLGGRKEPWIDNNVMNLEKTAKQYVELQKEIYINGYINPDTEKWDYLDFDDECSFDENSFGYFVDYEFVSQVLNKNSVKESYSACVGPVAFEVPLSVYITTTNTGHNNALTKLLLSELVSNTTIMKSNTQNENGLLNHKNGLEDISRDDTVLKALYDSASGLAPVVCSVYDTDIENSLELDYTLASWEEVGLNVDTVKSIDVDTVLNKIKTTMTIILPDTVIVDRIVEQPAPDPVPDDPDIKEDAEENDKGEGLTEGGESGDGKSVDPSGNPSGINDGQHHEHQYSEWVIVKEATCDEKGSMTRTCSVCNNVETAEIPATGFVKNGIFVNSGYMYKVLTVKGKKGTIAFAGFDAAATSKVVIPATVKAGGITFSVTAIADNACKNVLSVKSVTVSKNITRIGKSAFEGCKKLTSVNIKTGRLTKNSIGKKSFKGVNSKVTFKCPKKKLANYKKWLKKSGVPKKAKFSK